MRQFDLATYLFTYFGFLVALTMHEAAKAYMAKFLGDNSPEINHRATINPLPHIDILGTVVFPLVMLLSPMPIPILFGWAKPVDINTGAFKKIRRSLNLIALAGPGANFLIAILCGLIMKYSGIMDSMSLFEKVSLRQNPLIGILIFTALSNIVIGVFNLLPFPGSDGWKLIINNVNYNLAQKLTQVAGYITLVMFGLLILGGLTPIIAFILNIYSSVFGLSLL